MAKIIGIDLGTTTSLVSYLKNGKPEIIPHKLGKRLTDSVVGVANYYWRRRGKKNTKWYESRRN